ncbi:nucleoside hydrolase [Enterococcus malodoratus]|uniref:nucleoside hydrolase n=1 Tax=Enterococcus malodoratus TaxID=71451 RepID=UPI0039AF397B
MRKVIFDCDNTFGLGNRDVDDGLTLFYLLGSPVIDLLGVTLTYGNDTLEKVTQMTKELQRRLDLSFNYYGNHQAEFLAEQVNCYPNEVTILATGALTNLAEAKRIDPLFFEKVKEIIVMGGTTEPLVVNHHPVTELNFSCDPLAAETVLLSQTKVVIMNGHMTSEAFFSITELEQFLSLAKEVIPQESAEWIRYTLEKWIEWNEKVFHFSGFCNWDMTTAVYLERPELFSDECFYLAEQQTAITKGQMLLTEKSIYPVRMPKKLLAISEFNQLIIDRMVKGLQ